MFNKNKSPAPSPQPRPSNTPAIPPLPDLPSSATARPTPASATPARGLSTLSSDLKFEGTISGAGDLQIDGQIKGDLRVGRLIIGETGAVEGNVSADYVEVRGRIVGATSGKQVKLVSTAYVDGDITAEQLSIDIGAYFQGRCVQGRRDAAPAAPKPASAPPSDLAPIPQQPAAQVIDMKPH